MRKLTTALVLVAGIAAGIVAAPGLRAEDHHIPSGMMGTGDGNSGGGMMGMMNMMRRMGRMMDHCGGMMQGRGGRPNEQWRKPAPDSNG